jgi:hypothetical protein
MKCLVHLTSLTPNTTRCGLNVNPGQMKQNIPFLVLFMGRTWKHACKKERKKEKKEDIWTRGDLAKFGYRSLEESSKI